MEPLAVKNKLILPCLRGTMGSWVFYSTVMSPAQISTWIQPAKDIREAKSLDEELQRTLKERKAEIAKYLKTRGNRFFNTIIVGVYGGLPEWHEFIIQSKLEDIGGTVDENYEMGLMEFKGNEKLFAIDGQHRVVGIDFALSDDSIPNPLDISGDRYSVILVAHLDDPIGRKTTRQLFSDINRKAKSVPKKDQIIIDEETLAHIVTRRVFAEYPHFKNGTLIDYLYENTNLQPGDTTHFTNLTNLSAVVEALKKLVKLKEDVEEWDESNVEQLKKKTFDFFDWAIANISEYKQFFVLGSKSLSTLRKDNKYLLFRPIGIKLLARIYTHFAQKKKLTQLTNMIGKLDFVMPSSPFNGILWNEGNMETKNEPFAFQLALYLMRQPVKNKEDLLEDYRRIIKNKRRSLPAMV